MKTVLLTVLVIAAMSLLRAKTGQSISCDQVTKSLGPCMPYLVNEGGNPSSECCNGVRNLRSLTPSRGDRQAACHCMKQEAGKVHNIKPSSASNLPGKCGVQVDVPIRRDVDCESVK